MQALADPRHALHHRQFGQPVIGQFQERLRIDGRVHRAHFAGDVFKARGIEDFLEGGEVVDDARIEEFLVRAGDGVDDGLSGSEDAHGRSHTARP